MNTKKLEAVMLKIQQAKNGNNLQLYAKRDEDDRRNKQSKHMICNKLFDYFPVFQELSNKYSAEKLEEMVDIFFKSWSEFINNYSKLEDMITEHKEFEWK